MKITGSYEICALRKERRILTIISSFADASANDLLFGTVRTINRFSGSDQLHIAREENYFCNSFDEVRGETVSKISYRTRLRVN